MKDKLKRFVISHAFLERWMFLFYHYKNAKKAADESERRKNISLFDYKALSADIPFGPEERVIDNNLYGYAHHIKKYAGIKTDLKAYLEHGLFWGGMVHPDERFWHFKRIITFSENRKKDIERNIPGKEAVPIGPYIFYAEELFSSEERVKLKSELGKTLLVFPSHSVRNLEAKFDFEQFIEEINRVKKDFDTVLVSLYFIDALNPEKVKIYTDQGYRVVTSGHKFDHNFVARQKTIIGLADYTMSNEVGTHIGYCVCLEKPHYLFKQALKRISNSEEEIKRHQRLFNSDEQRLMHEQHAEVAKTFGVYQPEITQEQRELVDKFWGIGSLKSPEELKALLG